MFYPTIYTGQNAPVDLTQSMLQPPAPRVSEPRFMEFARLESFKQMRTSVELLLRSQTPGYPDLQIHLAKLADHLFTTLSTEDSTVADVRIVTAGAAQLLGGPATPRWHLIVVTDQLQPNAMDNLRLCLNQFLACYAKGNQETLETAYAVEYGALTHGLSGSRYFLGSDIAIDLTSDPFRYHGHSAMDGWQVSLTDQEGKGYCIIDKTPLHPDALMNAYQSVVRREFAPFNRNSNKLAFAVLKSLHQGATIPIQAWELAQRQLSLMTPDHVQHDWFYLQNQYPEPCGKWINFLNLLVLAQDNKTLCHTLVDMELHTQTLNAEASFPLLQAMKHDPKLIPHVINWIQAITFGIWTHSANGTTTPQLWAFPFNNHEHAPRALAAFNESYLALAAPNQKSTPWELVTRFVDSVQYFTDQHIDPTILQPILASMELNCANFGELSGPAVFTAIKNAWKQPRMQTLLKTHYPHYESRFSLWLSLQTHLSYQRPRDLTVKSESPEVVMPAIEESPAAPEPEPISIAIEPEPVVELHTTETSAEETAEAVKSKKAKKKKKPKATATTTAKPIDSLTAAECQRLVSASNGDFLNAPAQLADWIGRWIKVADSKNQEQMDRLSEYTFKYLIHSLLLTLSTFNNERYDASRLSSVIDTHWNPLMKLLPKQTAIDLTQELCTQAFCLPYCINAADLEEKNSPGETSIFGLPCLQVAATFESARSATGYMRMSPHIFDKPKLIKGLWSAGIQLLTTQADLVKTLKTNKATEVDRIHNFVRKAGLTITEFSEKEQTKAIKQIGSVCRDLN